MYIEQSSIIIIIAENKTARIMNPLAPAPRRIVASRGAYTFAWNIEKARRRERRGNIEGAGQHAANTDYECWAREGRVVDSNFMHGRYKVPNKVRRETVSRTRCRVLTRSLS